MAYVRIHVDLSEFDNEDLAEHLENAGWTCIEPGKETGRQDLDDFIEGIKMIAELHELERVRAQFYQGNPQPAAQMLIDLFRDVRGAAL